MTAFAGTVGVVDAELVLLLVDCELEIRLAVLEAVRSELVEDSSAECELYH